MKQWKKKKMRRRKEGRRKSVPRSEDDFGRRDEYTAPGKWTESSRLNNIIGVSLTLL